MENNSILLAEDDVNLGYLMVENLKGRGFSVTLVKTGNAAIDALKKHRFCLCVLDIMLPGVDGFSIAHYLKQEYPALPFIFLTARSQEQDKLRGFEMGADDYVTKPFSFKELHYRIVAILRRANNATPVVSQTVSLAGLTLHPSERILEIAGSRKKLSQREASIVQLLMLHSGTYISRSEILKKIWGNDDYFAAKSMDVYITRIRKLLKDEPSIEVENLYGMGYRIKSSC